MNVVSYGGGVNSTAMIIGMYQHGIPIDLILFADTGGEQPHTYEFVRIFGEWLKEHGLPPITPVEYFDKNGERLTLEKECINGHRLPALAYGWKTCSQKHKISPQDKFCNNDLKCRAVWASKGKVQKYIGYDAGELGRVLHAMELDRSDKKYARHYPLADWSWFREDCINAILEQGLPKPKKSSCFFCPSMKKQEILDLRHDNPELFERAINIERNAKENLLTIKGLGREWSWEDMVNAHDAQVPMCAFFDSVDTPCGCFDGGE